MSLLLLLITYIAYTNANMDVLVIGDWGGSELAPYTTEEEVSTAAVMNTIANSISPSMIWALGDNFYLKGVKDIDDVRFTDTWKNVFNGTAIGSIPFYVVAGNHDHYGNVSAEVAYSSVSPRWIYPDYWYSKTWNIPNTEYTLQLVMIDTILACGNVMDQAYCESENISVEECILSPPGPENQKLADAQWNWIAQELNSSDADFLIVGGHYPVWSIAEHGPTSCLVDQLRPLLIANNITMYINGHDHTFEFIVENDYPDLAYVVTGGAHVCDTSTKHSSDIPTGSLRFHGCNNGGFTRIHVDNNGLYLQYYFANDTNVYYTTPTYTSRKPRLLD